MRIAIVTSTSWFTSSTIGGAEKQIYYISTSLARAGHHVDLFTMDIDKPFSKDGVNIIPAWDPNRGIPKLRYFIYRMPELKKKLLVGKYNVVYMRGISFFSSSVVNALRRHSTNSIIGIASDANLSWQISKQSLPAKNKWQYIYNWLLLKHFQLFSLPLTDTIATQNMSQCIMAKHFSQNVIYCPNIFQPPLDIDDSYKIVNSDVIWIGGLRRVKGVETLLSIIDSLPNIKFTVIGETTGSRQVLFTKEFIQRPNVNYIKHVPNSNIHLFLRSSKLLLNTSPHEGFSNTFLEAWFAEIPVISLYANPSKLLSNLKLGYCTNGNIELLTDKIVFLLKNKSRRDTIGRNAKKYVLDEHSADKVVSIFENIQSPKVN